MRFCFGGADSTIIVHIIATYFRDYLWKIHFCFSNTGIEYRATLDFIKYLEEHYQIKIDEVRGMPIPLAVKTYGVPLISKKISDNIHRLQLHDFNWEDESFDKLIEKYPKSKSALRWWCDNWGEDSKFNISYHKWLKEKILSSGIDFNVSNFCCKKSKKDPLQRYQTNVNCDLLITGERKSEGGARASAHKSCYEVKSIRGEKIDHFMPLWFWNNATKQYYIEHEKIKLSDCYEVYGMKRTGCTGCPYANDCEGELEIMKKFEPKLYNFCWNVFGNAYRWMGINKN